MNTGEAIALFLAYSHTEKQEFLARLLYELTITARDNYEVGGDGLLDPQRARRINEVYHRVSAFLWALLRNDAQRYPDDVLIRIVLEEPDDAVLRRQLNEAFARVTMQHVTAA